jgi:pantothenate kinase
VAVVANKFKALFTPQEQPAPNHKTEGDMPLTKEELEQIGSMIGQAVATNTEAAIKPLAEKVDALQANQKQLAETLTANSAPKRKQSAKRLRRSMAISWLTRCQAKLWTRCSSRWAKLLRWAPTMLSSTKKPAHQPQTNTSSKEPE